MVLGSGQELVRYENSIYKHILPTLGKQKLEDLTPAMLQKFYAELKSAGRLRETERFGPGLSDRSVRACHEVIRMALDRAVEERLLHSNPADACKLPPKHRKEMKVLHKDEIQRFLIQPCNGPNAEAGGGEDRRGNRGL